MINYLLSRNQRIAAAAYPYRTNVRQVSVDDVLTGTSPAEDGRLTAIILSVKTPKKKTQGLELSGKTLTSLRSYEHLILCRELTKGGLFYLLSTTEEESARLFGYDCCSRYVGAYAVVYEPQDTRRLIFSVPLLSTNYPLMPACRPDIIKFDAIPVVCHLKKGASVGSFFIEVSDLQLDGDRVVRTCGFALCDGSHARNVLCPGMLVSSRLQQKTLPVSVSTASGGLTNVRFQSCHFTTLFVHKSLLQQTEELCCSLKPRINYALEAYAKANISFLVAGWYKAHHRDARDGVVTTLPVPGIHISMICPRKQIIDCWWYNSIISRRNAYRSPSLSE